MLIVLQQFQVMSDLDFEEQTLASTVLFGEEEKLEEISISIACLNMAVFPIRVDAYLLEKNRPKRIIYSNNSASACQHKVQFIRPIVCKYFFEYKQKLVIEVYQVEENQRLLGVVEATVGQIYKSQSKGILKQIAQGGYRSGELYLKCEKMNRKSQKFIEFSLVGRNLDVGTSFLCFGEGSAHWKLFKLKSFEDHLQYQSQTKVGKTNRFEPVKLDSKEICSNNPKQPMALRFFKEQLMIGETIFTVASLNQGKYRYGLTSNGEKKGEVIFDNYRQSFQYRFLDYLQGGLQIQTMMGIDFTACKGQPFSPSSLHSNNTEQKSSYEKAFGQICQILQDYNQNQCFSLYGLGKETASNNKTGYFPLVEHQGSQNMYLAGKISSIYQKSLSSRQFEGPRLCSPLLRQAMKKCRSNNPEEEKHLFLLLLIAGDIQDKQEFVSLLQEAAHLPLTIVVVGIGKEDDWGVLEYLDDFYCKVADSRGVNCSRSMVEFIQFSKLKQDGVCLARDALFHLSKSVEDYYAIRGVFPSRHLQRSVGENKKTR